MATLPLTYWWMHDDGKLYRYGRTTTTLDVPGIPQSVAVAQAPAAATADLTWTAPASDGGSPITNYVVNRTPGGTPTTTADGTARSFHFTGLTAGTVYSFTVAAINAQGTGRAASVSSSFYRFPGDTLPKITGKGYLGLDENDQDPTVVGVGETSMPETTAGVPCGAMRSYFNTSSDVSSLMATPGGSLASRARTMHAHGRLSWPSISFGNWGLAGDGRNSTDFLNWITYVEEQLSAPVWITFAHEPENNLSDGTEAEWGTIYKDFRHQMNIYAGTGGRGGVGVYKFKNLALAPILTAAGYSTGDGSRGIGPFWKGAAYTTGVTAAASTDVFSATGHRLSDGCRVRLLAPPAGLSTGTDYFVISSTANTLKLAATRGGSAVNVTADGTGITIIYHDVWDFAGVDGYQYPVNGDATVGRTGQDPWTTAITATTRWVEDSAHTYTLSFGEYGIHGDDADAGTAWTSFYNTVRDGTHDIVGVNYFNSNTGKSDIANHHRWLLKNTRIADGGPNAHFLDKFVASMTDPRSIHFWDVTAPDGTPYPRPAGV